MKSNVPVTNTFLRSKIQIMNPFLFLDPEGSGQLYKVSLTSSIMTPRESEVTSSPVTDNFTTNPIKPSNFRIGYKPGEIVWTPSPSPKVTRYEIRWRATDELNGVHFHKGEVDVKSLKKESGIEPQTTDTVVTFVLTKLIAGLVYKVYKNAGEKCTMN